jgi:5'-3' exonuclease
MGIKHFFTWFKTNFSNNFIRLIRNEKLNDVVIDNLMLDMNGIFHNSAQKIYEYGNFKRPVRLLNKKFSNNRLKKQLKVFEDVCRNIEYIFLIVNPAKKLILCVDGPAPQSKQNQQRQRRFRSVTEKSDNEISDFDSNCITPGTKFMDYLGKYIDWYIKKKISEDERWRNIEVVFSNEKVAGEGEHKIINFIRKYGIQEESYCIYGMDADLIMLSMGTHFPNFYILRDDPYDRTIEHYCIKIEPIKDELSEMMRWECESQIFDKKIAINDFIFMCFMVGNDFLPNIPSIEIIENGIEIMLNVYKAVGSSEGHLTEIVDGNVLLRPFQLSAFLGRIALYEKEILENKLTKKRLYFKDELLENCSIEESQGKYLLDIEAYRFGYMEGHFPSNENVESICHKYIEGLQWVLSYYTKGVPNWKWKFEYHYAPPANILSENTRSFTFPEYRATSPSTPFQQLISVLPPKSSNLIPQPLNFLLTDESSPIKQFCPDTFRVDLAGKRREWEGIVILPIIDCAVLEECYSQRVKNVDSNELKRNIFGQSFIYKYNENKNGIFNSYYGNIENYKVDIKIIEI